MTAPVRIGKPNDEWLIVGDFTSLDLEFYPVRPEQERIKTTAGQLWARASEPEGSMTTTSPTTHTTPTPPNEESRSPQRRRHA